MQKYLIIRSLILLIINLILIVSTAQAAQIALIIDDMGNNKQDAQAFSLPTNVTFAILPHKPLSTRFANRAALQQRDVMLHMPMESLSRNNQEDNVLLSTMPPHEIVNRLKKALSTVPNAVGVNNHMGSRLTQLTLHMSVTMEFLSEQGLFFVDSRTTRYSKAEKIAKKVGIMATKRNVFLDHTPTAEQIDKQFQRLLRLATKYGYAVGIGHPYPATIKYLKDHLETLSAQGFILVKMRDILATQPSFAYHKQLPRPIL